MHKLRLLREKLHKSTYANCMMHLDDAMILSFRKGFVIGCKSERYNYNITITASGTVQRGKFEHLFALITAAQIFFFSSSHLSPIMRNASNWSLILIIIFLDKFCISGLGQLTKIDKINRANEKKETFLWQ